MTRACTASPRRRRAGFTLMEVMAAVLLTGIVVSIALAFQINLGSSMEGARERLRTERQAVALLDRMARDIAGAYFIVPSQGGQKAAEPWVFVSTRDFAADDEKSDGLKFITRNYRPRALDEHASDLAVVAYFLNPMPDAPGYELLRWRSPHMPQSYDRSFPSPDDPAVDVVGEGVWHFGVSMIDRDGVEIPEWNSALGGARRGLPMAVRLEISMLDPNWQKQFDDGEFDADFDEYEPEEEPKVFSKLVDLPLRPLDWTFLAKDLQAQATGDLNQGDDTNGGDDADDSADGDNGGVDDGSNTSTGQDPFGFGDDDQDDYEPNDFRD